MTREEKEDAIDIIQSILDKYEEDECLVTEITIGDEDIKAFEMAIKALEQEPTTKNDLGVDAISRADVDTVIEQMRVKMKDGRMYILAEVVQDIIRELPSVTPQEPTIKALGEELRIDRKGIADEKVLIGYNLAVAICNKHLGESEE